MGAAESWHVCGCLFESYIAQFRSRCGDAHVVRLDAHVVRLLTPWLIINLAGDPNKAPIPDLNQESICG